MRSKLSHPHVLTRIANMARKGLSVDGLHSIFSGNGVVAALYSLAPSELAKLMMLSLTVAGDRANNGCVSSLDV